MLGDGLEDALVSGESERMDRSPRWGMIPRAVDDLFEQLQQLGRDGTSTFTVHCSYMQIYNEKLFDLLQVTCTLERVAVCGLTLVECCDACQDRKRRRPLIIRETAKAKRKAAEVYVQNLAEYRVSSAEDVLMLLQVGGRNRAVRGTEYNEASSRSHALLQLSIEVETTNQGGVTVIRRAKLNLVDLAGSEKWNTELAMEADRQKELTAINSSLSALGNCISALTEKKRTHVPYRDSKLTRLLQDSLGGNTRTTVVACMSPMGSCAEESISTLGFADRARRVMTRVRANEVVDDAVLLARAQKEIKRLRAVIAKSERGKRIDVMERELQALRDENARLRALAAPRSRPGSKASRAGTRGTMGTRGTPTSRRGRKHGQLTPKSSSGLGFPPLAPASAALEDQAARETKPLARSSAEPDDSVDISEYGAVDSAADTGSDSASGAAGAGGAGAADSAPEEHDSYSMDSDRLSDSEDDRDTHEVISELRNTLKRGDMDAKEVLARVAKAEDDCDRELVGLVASVDSIAAERKALEAQLATLESGMKARLDSMGASDDDGYDDDDGFMPEDAQADSLTLAELDGVAAPGIPESDSRHSTSAGSGSAAVRSRRRAPKPPGLPAPAGDVEKKPRKLKHRGSKRGKLKARSSSSSRKGGSSPRSSGATPADGMPSLSDFYAGGDDDLGSGPFGSSLDDVLNLASPITSPKGGAQLEFYHDKTDVGARVKVFSTRFDEWNEGTVTAHDPVRGMHMVQYDSGERKWHIMRDKEFHVLSRPSRIRRSESDSTANSMQRRRRGIKRGKVRGSGTLAAASAYATANPGRAKETTPLRSSLSGSGRLR